MKKATLTLSIATLLIASVCVNAQDRKKLSPDEQQKYVVSAKSGIVNMIEGDLRAEHEKTGWASLFEAQRDDWQRLTVGDELQMNDLVRTGPSSRAEILLTPGIYLRMSGDTEFVFQFDGESSQAIKLRRGSIILESSVDSWIQVSTPKSDVHMVRAGLYRIDATNDRLEVATRDGKAFVGESEVKGGRKATVSEGPPVVAKFDKKSEDVFDVWSKDRAKSLIALNHQLSKPGLKSSGLISFIDNVWIFDRFSGCYTFLPWSTGFSSPYGWGYSVFNPYWYFRPYWYNGWGTRAGGGTVRGGSRGSSGGSTVGSGSPSSGRGNRGRGYQPPSGAPRISPHPPSRIDVGGGRIGGGGIGSMPSRSAPAPSRGRSPKN